MSLLTRFERPGRFASVLVVCGGCALPSTIAEAAQRPDAPHQNLTMNAPGIIEKWSDVVELAIARAHLVNAKLMKTVKASFRGVFQGFVARPSPMTIYEPISWLLEYVVEINEDSRSMLVDVSRSPYGHWLAELIREKRILAHHRHVRRPVEASSGSAC